MKRKPPTPVYHADSLIKALGIPELFVLTIVRLWAGVCRDAAPQASHWWDGFMELGIDRQAAAAFDIFMQILFYGSRRELGVNGVAQASLSKDEALLLRFVSAIQHHQYSRSLDILETWLSEEELELAWEPAMLFVAGLNGARMVVPLCQEDFVSTARVFRCVEPRIAEVPERWADAQRWLH